MILIPVFNPNNELLKLVLKLIKKHKFKPAQIFVVDDHSENKKSKIIFKHLTNIGCYVRVNKKNRGKGSAIKFAINFAKKNNIKFIVFADGDGQHADGDIKKIYNLGKKDGNFIIGERDFKHAPTLNKISNYFSNYLFNNITKLNMKDTQCGLRLVPNNCYEVFSKINENKFDFELVSLFELYKNNIFIKKLKIETIYFKNKYISNFNKVFDTLKIFRVFLIYKFFR